MPNNDRTDGSRSTLYMGEIHGYPIEVCLIDLGGETMFTEGKHHTGYLYLPKDHPWEGIGCYDDISCWTHCGLTYSDYAEYDGKEWFVVGFDCAHAGDTVENCPLHYVTMWLGSMAMEAKNAQLAALSPEYRI